ncbi:MAG TPA: hypothetical protein PLC43_04860 [Caldisericia bacterium]|nr:hypothetical protein [Caldisericia bacterium]
MKKEIKENKEKKRKNQEPTFLQKKAFMKFAEKMKNNEKIVMGKIMKEAGYKEGTARRPGVLTKSKSWKQLLEEYLPDEKLLQEHKKITLQDKDKQAKMKAIHEAYKLKDKFPREKIDLTSGGKPIPLLARAKKLQNFKGKKKK